MATRGEAQPIDEFHVRLRTAIDRLQITQRTAAELLGIATNTLETWLSSPGSATHVVPHHLIQIGALHWLALRKSVIRRNIRRGGTHRRWEVSADGIGWTEVLNLTDWLRSRAEVNEKSLTSVRSCLVNRGIHVGTGLRARRIAVEVA